MSGAAVVSSVVSMASSVQPEPREARGKEKGPVRHRRGPDDLFSSERSAQTRTQRPREEGLSYLHKHGGDGPRIAHLVTLSAPVIAVNDSVAGARAAPGKARDVRPRLGFAARLFV